MRQCARNGRRSSRFTGLRTGAAPCQEERATELKKRVALKAGPIRCLPRLGGMLSHQIKHTLRRIGAEADAEVAIGFSGGGFAPRE